MEWKENGFISRTTAGSRVLKEITVTLTFRWHLVTFEIKLLSDYRVEIQKSGSVENESHQELTWRKMTRN